jgi:ectoine hydroxylase-related dioxygenase (phytanoyl-CoA dioxygenase family)
MDYKTNFEELNEKGITILREVINHTFINELKKYLEISLKKHREIQLKNNNEINVEGVALNIIGDNNIYIELLKLLIEKNIINNIKKYYFNSNFILNSFSGLNNLPGNTNFSAIIHRDSKFYSNQTPLMLNVLIMLDDFTNDNGPTLLLPYSHKIIEKPTDDYFYENSIKALGKKGDILIFNSDIWHASSINNTNYGRMALPITFSKSFIKQLMDYPRYLGYDKINEFDEEILSLLGYNSRVPSNLNEWYQPEHNRFYKKNQD